MLHREDLVDLSELKIYVNDKEVIGNCPHCYNTGRKVNINSWREIFTLSLSEVKDLVFHTKCEVCNGEGLIYKDE